MDDKNCYAISRKIRRLETEVERLTAELVDANQRLTAYENGWGEPATINALRKELVSLRSQQAAVPDVDWLSNVIRSADGGNKLGAGALAEKIVEAMLAVAPQPIQPSDGAMDAARYRWLRELPNADSLNLRFIGCDLDRVIDAAIQKGGE